MNEDKRDPSGADSLPNTEVIGELIRRAGPRSSAEDYGLLDFKSEAAERWEAVVARRGRRLRLRRLGVAALAIAATFGATTIALRLLASPPATVERIVGSLELLEASGARALNIGDTVPAGATLSTDATGRAALRLDNGMRVRLDRNSALELASERRLKLAHGTVHIDATGAPDADYLDVQTAQGTARDIGTVFQVSQSGEAVEVRVREGRVSVKRGGERYEADAGEALKLSADGSVETLSVGLAGPQWDWALETAPTFALEGSTLGAYLDWLGRETGWHIRFGSRADDALRESLLHGSLKGVTPDETPDLVLTGSGLSYRLENGTLILEPTD